MNHTATYSPDDNKIRIYPACRLDADEYATVKAAGYKWAPNQQLFVAPMWTPERERVAIELAGEITDDDSSLSARAEERSERFDGYRPGFAPGYFFPRFHARLVEPSMYTVADL